MLIVTLASRALGSTPPAIGRSGKLPRLRRAPPFQRGPQSLHLFETQGAPDAISFGELIGFPPQAVGTLNRGLTADLRVSAHIVEIISQKRRQFRLHISVVDERCHADQNRAA